MDKKKLRLLYKKKRAELDSLKIENLSIEIANQILILPLWGFENFHVFMGVEKMKEINTNHIISVLQGRDKNIIIPKVVSNTHLAHYMLTDATKLKINQWDVLEPINGIEVEEKKIQVVFIPLLAYDCFGNRLGYGKGYYDRFLDKCAEKCLKIGLSFFTPEKKILTSPLDIKLNYCVTPKKIYKFN
ncbi:MAG: 5-formyltetrahydrofolate cyclo-ligase [Flavobacteriaceae bacterium]